MLKGDLATTPLAPLLLQLATDEVTGCLHVSDPAGDEALIYFKSGLVYAVSVPGRRPQLGAKLISSGALAPEALADALDAQRTELQGWRLGELLVHLGYVDQPVVEAFVKEQVHDAVWDLIRWTDGRWKFRKNEKTREDVAPPIPVADLFDNLRERGIQWEAISALVHGPTAVPVLSTRGGGAPETMLDSDAWSMLCKIDGERSVAELARDCGYTMFEAGRVLLVLVQAGLVDIEEDVEVTPAPAAAPAPVVEPEERYGATSISSALAAEAAAAEEPAEEEDGVAALARLVTEVAAGLREEEALPVAVPEQPSHAPLQPMDDQSFAASLARVSSALADVLGPAQETADPFEVPAELRIRRKPKVIAPQPVSPEDERRRRVREAAAAELAAAHALAEALRSAQTAETAETAETAHESVANVVDLAVVRREAEAAAKIEAERQATAARVEAEEAARREAEDEAARLEAERVDAERAAAEEAARLEAERAAAEEAARLAAEEEAARLEAERLAAEAAARIAAEEAARLEAERLTAEEAARLEAERLAAEEAARIEAERLAAEEAARVEAERLAAEEAARIEAERLAAEEAARLEAERLTAEEAARIAAEEEAARLAAEQEAARVEAERLASAEAARLAAERADAEDEAWAEYWQREAVAAEQDNRREAEATALLAELNAQAVAPAVPEQPADPTPIDDAEPEPVQVREPATVGARPMSEMADTAALLRELSSLGLDDDPPPAPTPARPPAYRPPPGAAEPKKKKRGLFGR